MKLPRIGQQAAAFVPVRPRFSARARQKDGALVLLQEWRPEGNMLRPVEKMIRGARIRDFFLNVSYGFILAQPV